MYRKIPIDELEKYYIINRDGSILRRYDKSIIEFKENSYGYYQYYFKELKSVFLVHRIIISKFCPNENDISLSVNHIDLCKTNNNITNLEWVSIKENNIHSRNNQDYKRLKNQVRLSDYDVIEIYNLLKDKKTVQYISEKFNVSKSTIMSIKNKRIHYNILKDFDDIPKRNSRCNISHDTVKDIVSEINDGIKPCIIAKKYNVSNRFVTEIKHGKIFKDFEVGDTEKFLGGEKLKEEDVLKIIELYNDGLDIHKLCEKYHVTRHTIQNILRRRTWKKLTKNIYIDY